MTVRWRFLQKKWPTNTFMVLSFSCLIIIKKICLFFAPSSLYISFPLVWIYILKSEEEERKEGRNIYIRGQRGKSAKAIKHSIAIMAPLSSGHRQPEKGGPFERERLFLSLCISFFFHPVRVRIQCAVMVMKMRVSKVSKREILICIPPGAAKGTIFLLVADTWRSKWELHPSFWGGRKKKQEIRSFLDPKRK